MQTEKQKKRLIFFSLILVVCIVAGAFGANYYLSTKVPAEIVAEEEAEKPDEIKVTIVEPEQPQEAEAQEEETEEAEEPEEVIPQKQEEYFGPLSVTNGVLSDTEGNPVVLKGISTHNLSWYPEYVNDNAAYYMHKEWGVNLLRLSMYTSEYNGYCVVGDQEREKLKDLIDTGVTAATRNNMYVIIDWHILSDGNPNTYKAEAIQFFGEMVRKYCDYDNVIYEICNEPNGDTTWEDICSYANEVIPVIRSVDSDAIILVGTPRWCQVLDEPTRNPLRFDNIMYTYHFYAGSHGDIMRNELKEALRRHMPIFVSEFGITDASGNGEVDIDSANAWMDIIREYNVSYAIWNLSNKDESSALIKTECKKITDWLYGDLKEEGQWMLDVMLEYKKGETN